MFGLPKGKRFPLSRVSWFRTPAGKAKVPPKADRSRQDSMPRMGNKACRRAAGPLHGSAIIRMADAGVLRLMTGNEAADRFGDRCDIRLVRFLRWAHRRSGLLVQRLGPAAC